MCDTADELVAIESRADAATHGPWRSATFDVEDGYALGAGIYQESIPLLLTTSGVAVADAEFIAHARTDVPALIAALREAWADNDRIGAMVEWQAEVIVDARDALTATRVEWYGGLLTHPTMKVPTDIDAVLAILNFERTAHPSKLDKAEAAIARVRVLHQPHRIYDECDHAHEEGEPGTVNCWDFLTCEDAYLYSICSTCCTEDPENPEQSEWCAEKHKHGKDESICATIAALDEEA